MMILCSGVRSELERSMSVIEPESWIDRNTGDGIG